MTQSKADENHTDLVPVKAWILYLNSVTTIAVMFETFYVLSELTSLSIAYTVGSILVAGFATFAVVSLTRLRKLIAWAGIVLFVVVACKEIYQEIYFNNPDLSFMFSLGFALIFNLHALSKNIPIEQHEFRHGVCPYNPTSRKASDYYYYGDLHGINTGLHHRRDDDRHGGL